MRRTIFPICALTMRGLRVRLLKIHHAVDSVMRPSRNGMTRDKWGRAAAGRGNLLETPNTVGASRSVPSRCRQPTVDVSHRGESRTPARTFSANTVPPTVLTMRSVPCRFVVVHDACAKSPRPYSATSRLRSSSDASFSAEPEVPMTRAPSAFSAKRSTPTPDETPLTEKPFAGFGPAGPACRRNERSQELASSSHERPARS